MTWHIEDLLQATGGTLVAGPMSAEFAGIGIDSRIIPKDHLFVAIRGAKYDGHAFVPELMAGGIKGIMIHQPLPDCDQLIDWSEAGGCCIMVADTTRALGDLAAFQRQRAGIPVVAITGSNGKTTTKELTASIVSQEKTILATQGNLNNEIGLPLTLFRLSRAHEAAVVELGMNQPGEIRRLAKISRPDIGVITNIGAAHLEGLQDIEHVMAAKAELLEYISADGAVVLNADDAFGRRLAEMASSRVVCFGQADHADVRAEAIRQAGMMTEFNLVLPDAQIPVTLHVPGRYMLANALAAAAASFTMGVSIEAIKAGIEAFRPVAGRMAHTETRSGVHVIDDAYNANPGSMKAAIDALSTLKGGHGAILVAGDMLELGEASAEMHEEIGRAAAADGIDQLYLTGSFARYTANGAVSGGMPEQAVFVGSKSEILEKLSEAVSPGDWVLVKGSRTTGMEQIVQMLLHPGASQSGQGGI
ncbi:MAG: UDP-N-acetylmuramoyl-tripeptide--D-alanyl-D-alanine ligase [Desulfobacterales bacterium]|nr:UDP-N-acetylmuramoyl-tripeptide--D-alanyl-D-alanine ligase [Desulfobacterales bacterium]